jgi:Tol biopolymer transport system component
VDSRGRQGDGNSGLFGVAGYPAISADGRFVAFPSDATNLVRGDTNGTTDIFVRDRLTGTTERVSVSSSGGQSDGFSEGPALSADGRFVAFHSSASNLVPGDDNFSDDVFVRDRLNGTTEIVSINNSGEEGNSLSFRPDLSADGRFVAFSSFADNLVPGSQFFHQVFLREGRHQHPPRRQRGRSIRRI